MASFFFLLFLLPVFGAVGVYYYYSQDLPSLSALKDFHPKTVSFFYADDGRLIGEFSREYRLVVPLSRMPRHVVNAFVAAEDANYFSHPGIDLPGIIRALIANFRAGHIVQGASTITQQVIRSFLLTPEKTYSRKIREMILAYYLEKNLTKDEILYLYLNQIYLGHGAYGVEGAAEIYFGKHVGQLGLAEATMIAGLVKAPSKLSPYRRPEEVKQRQKYVLGQMADAGFITEDQARAAYEETIHLYNKPYANLEVVPYFTEYVRQLVIQMFGEDRLYEDGLKVYTTVNIEKQKTGQEALREGLTALAKRQGYSGPIKHLDQQEAVRFAENLLVDGAVLTDSGRGQAIVTKVDKKGLSIATRTGPGRIDPGGFKWALRGRSTGKVFSAGDVIWVRPAGGDAQDLYVLDAEPTVQGALVCMENQSGRVKAMIGGLDFRESQFNRAVQAHRQPGSSFKPFIYATAIDQGYTPSDVIWDEPIQYQDHGKVWSPQNYDRKYLGPTTLYEGLIKSRNVVAVRLLEQVGVAPVIQQAQKMGITSKLAPYLSLALGSSEVTLLDMVSAYTVFPHQGRYTRPIFINRIEDRDGRVIAEFTPEPVQALDPRTAYVVLNMMQGVVQRGTATKVAQLKRPVGGKTGTTNDLADAWFIGFTPEYTTGVWVGRDQRERLGRGETGGRTAAPIFLDFMQDILEGQPVTDFVQPQGITFAEIDSQTGNLADDWTERPFRVAFKSEQVGPSKHSEYYFAGDQPSQEYPYPQGQPGMGNSQVQLIYQNGRLYKVIDPYQPQVLTEERPTVRPGMKALPDQPMHQGDFVIREERLY